MSGDNQLMHGTLDVLVLKTLAWGPRHGYAIAKWIRQTTRELLVIEERALYLCLHRLQARGWLEADWGFTENNRRAKFYRLTDEGERQLALEKKRWSEYAGAVSMILDATSG